MVYLISCKLCKDQYDGSAYKNNSKTRFMVHKSDINTGNHRCGEAKHFLIKCADICKLENIEVYLIQQVEEGDYDAEGKFWCREMHWQASGTGTALIEKVIGQRTSKTIFILYV